MFKLFIILVSFLVIISCNKTKENTSSSVNSKKSSKQKEVERKKVITKKTQEVAKVGKAIKVKDENIKITAKAYKEKKLSKEEELKAKGLYDKALLLEKTKPQEAKKSYNQLIKTIPSNSDLYQKTKKRLNTLK